jgi:hypothetical protein
MLDRATLDTLHFVHNPDLMEYSPYISIIIIVMDNIDKVYDHSTSGFVGDQRVIQY